MLGADSAPAPVLNEPAGSDDLPTFTPEFIIAVDTREQLPYRFVGFDRVEKGRRHIINQMTATETLSTGDYSIIGMENRVCVERKSLADFVGTLTTGRDRFKRELERMGKIDYPAIVVEASWLDISEWSDSGMNPKALINSIIAWSIDYRAKWFLAADRCGGETFTFNWISKAFKKIKNDN